MLLNEAVIPHYKCTSIPFKKLKDMVKINQKYLKEKDTWYKINGKLKYFKVRNDYRLFTEQFFSIFGRKIIGLDTINYDLATLKVIDVDKAVTKNGLLSDNFQKPDYHYYLVSELYNNELSDLVCYSEYSLVNLLKFFKETVANEDYEKIKDFLIKLFISDAFTLEADRNHHNIGFKIQKFDNIPYSQRLRPYLIKDYPFASHLIVKEDDFLKIKGLTPTPVYDNEKILGIDHKNVCAHKPGMIWRPIFPYKPELLFKNQTQASKISNQEYDGLDPNLAELFYNFTKESTPIMERLAYDNEYRKVLENYLKKNNQLCLLPKTIDYVNKTLEDRRKVFQKVLKY